MKPLVDQPKIQSKSRPLREKAFKNAQRRASASRTKSGPFLELYQFENDAESHAVRNRLSSLGLDYIAHNVSPGHPLQHEQLTHVGGKDQIPFLIDHQSGVHLYETSAILRYLSSEYEAPAQGRIAKTAQRLGIQLQGGFDRIAWVLSRPARTAMNLKEEALAAWKTFRSSARESSRRARKAPKSSAA